MQNNVTDKKQDLLKKAGIIPSETPVYGDSASAAAITRICRQYHKYYAPERQNEADPLFFPGFRLPGGP